MLFRLAHFGLMRDENTTLGTVNAKGEGFLLIPRLHVYAERALSREHYRPATLMACGYQQMTRQALRRAHLLY